MNNLYITPTPCHTVIIQRKIFTLQDPVPSPRPHLSAAQHTLLTDLQIRSDLHRLTSLSGLLFPLPSFSFSPGPPLSPPTHRTARTTSTKAVLSRLCVIQALSTLRR